MNTVPNLLVQIKSALITKVPMIQKLLCMTKRLNVLDAEFVAKHGLLIMRNFITGYAVKT
jgi:hypothetical protein